MADWNWIDGALMPDQPSPVRASAQELAQQIRQHTFEEFDVSLDESASLVAAALSAAEARGRQQAEQALAAEREKHDEEAYNDMVAAKDAAESRVAALTQALKDYGRHTPKCDRSAEGRDWPCDCGLDAILIGVQRCS